MEFITPMVTIELKEYQSLQKQIEQLSTPGEGDDLTPVEQQECIGILLTRALNNPGLFRDPRTMGEIDLGKYWASISYPTGPGIPVKVKFTRNTK